MRAVVESLGSELAQTAPTQSGVVLTELTRHIAPLLGETHPHLHPTSRVLFARSSHSRALASYRPERHREQMPREGRVFQLGRYLCKNPRFPRTRHPWLGRVVAAAYSS